MTEINYTITSADKNEYALIRESLIAPPTQMTEFIVTGLTTMCSFVILDRTDFIEFVIYGLDEIIHEIRIIKLFWTRRTSNIDLATFSEIMGQLFGKFITFEDNPLNLLTFRSNYRFAIKDMSYRMKMIMGMFDVDFSHRKFYFARGKVRGILRNGRYYPAKITKSDYIVIAIGSEVDSDNIPIDRRTYYSPIEDEFDEDEDDYNEKFLSWLKEMIPDLGMDFYFDSKSYLIMRREEKFVIFGGTQNMQDVLGMYVGIADWERIEEIFEDAKYSVEPEVMYIKYSILERFRPPEVDDGLDGKIEVSEAEYIAIGFDFKSNGIPRKKEMYNLKKMYLVKKDDDILVLSILRETVPDMEFILDTAGIIRMFCFRKFRVIDVSRNLARMTGFYGSNEDVEEVYYYRPPAKGYFNLTPVLYLTSNIGSVVHTYKNKECINRRILMRINNFYIQDFPIVCHNTEFSSIITSNSLSDVWFQLVDANFKPIILLAPIYLTAMAIPIPDRSLKFVEPNE